MDSVQLQPALIEVNTNGIFKKWEMMDLHQLANSAGPIWFQAQWSVGGLIL